MALERADRETAAGEGYGFGADVEGADSELGFAAAAEGAEAADPDADDADDGAGARLWDGDAGALPFDARAALLRLVKGPYISEAADPALWSALLNYAGEVRSRLADMFLELCIDAEAGVAFAKNVQAEDKDFPKAATSYTMTLLDTIMVLLLRKELQTAGAARVFIGKADLFNQMGQYRNIEKMDQAAYLKRLEASWSRLAERRLIVRSDVEGRFEISPVLKLVFGAEEAAAILQEYQELKQQLAGGSATEEPDQEREASLFDGLV